jgi:hypothetical protein
MYIRSLGHSATLDGVESAEELEDAIDQFSRQYLS